MGKAVGVASTRGKSNLMEILLRGVCTMKAASTLMHSRTFTFDFEFRGLSGTRAGLAGTEQRETENGRSLPLAGSGRLPRRQHLREHGNAFHIRLLTKHNKAGHNLVISSFLKLSTQATHLGPIVSLDISSARRVRMK